MSKSWWTLVGTVATLAGTLLAIAPDAPSVAEDDAMLMVGGRSGDHRGEPLHFRLEGKPVHGLYPGAVKQMKITVVNPLGFRIRLQQLSGKVVKSSSRGCPARSTSLQVRQYTGSLPVTVAARGRTSLSGTLPIVMPLDTTKKCAGSRFTIVISGVGYRADR